MSSLVICFGTNSSYLSFITSCNLSASVASTIDLSTPKLTYSFICKSDKSTVGRYLWIFTVPFPITLTFLSAIFKSTIFIPAFWIFSATSSVITASFSTKTSPVSGSTILSNAIFPVILVAKFSFLLNLYLPTLAKSYLLGSKNKPLNKFLAASTVGSSPGLNFLYISINASLVVFIGSLSIVVFIFGSSPNNSNICSSFSIPIALNKDVTGNFLVLSTLA